MARLLPRATQLESALETAAGSIAETPTPIRDVWSPDDCPADLLPWLAWGLSLDNWATSWPDSIKRARVANAIGIAKRKGTAASVRQVVASFGGSVAIREWWQTTPRGTPHTFDLVLTLDRDGAPASAEFADQVIAEVNRAKPARSHFTFTQGISATGRVGLAAAVRPAVFVRLDCAAPPA